MTLQKLGMSASIRKVIRNAMPNPHILQGYKWKAKSRLPSFANATDEEALYKPGRGADADPCSTWYPGHRAWEAPEVNNIANWVTTLPSLRAYIDLRSYGQMRALFSSLSLDRQSGAS